MNLDRLRTFKLLSQTLHFRRAAAQLHLSQSAVSQQISALEAELGAMLFERIGRRVYLTPAGRLLAEESGKLLATVGRVVEAVTALGPGGLGRLRLGASTTPGVYLLPDVLGAMKREMPQIQIGLRIANSSAIEEALLANELDLGVVGEDISNPELFQVVLAEDHIIGVASPALLREHKLARTRRLSAGDLGQLPLLARESGSATRRYVEAGLAKVRAKMQTAFEFPSQEAQVRAAAAGLGVAFVSQLAAAADLEAGRLFQISIAGLALVRPIIAAYHRDKHVTPAMKHLIQLTQRRHRAR